MTTKTRVLKPATPDELRDLLPNSGVFDMLDCVVEIYPPENATTDDIEKMVSTIESMINVVDVRVTSTPESIHPDNTTYQVDITEVPNTLVQRLTKREEN